VLALSPPHIGNNSKLKIIRDLRASASYYFANILCSHDTTTSAFLSETFCADISGKISF
jgi:hypothetical protein